MIDINQYDKIIGSSEFKEFKYPIPYVFKVSDNDYIKKTTTRYFVQKINDSNVIEVDFNNYNEISNILYKKVALTWHLSGPLYNSIKNGKLYEYGVYEKNLSELNAASKIIFNIKSFVTDYTQYAHFIIS
jgi:hypothetical protein